ncbi:MAG TPA: methyl-accepting chemotaxis protein, partial [Leptolyngbyaceae cyanobacterium M65_K2018_010]|nr:methyl-accepting chemotaxis protein [Leptolyngbyaceae cyanobacterium M65_K2018_010]
MASGMDYSQAYQKAERAYIQGQYQEAAAIVDRLVQGFPQDPSVLLLRGHIYCYGLQQYETASEQYRAVLQATSEPEFVDYANSGLDYIQQALGAGAAADVAPSWELAGETGDQPSAANGLDALGQELAWPETADLDNPPLRAPAALDDPFVPVENFDPFALADLELGDSLDDITFEDESSADGAEMAAADPFSTAEVELGVEMGLADNAQPFAEAAYGAAESAGEPQGTWSVPEADPFAQAPSQETSQAFVNPPASWPSGADDAGDDLTVLNPVSEFDLGELTSTARIEENYPANGYPNSSSLEGPSTGGTGNVDFLDEFDEFDDLGSLPDFELSDSSAGFTTPSVGTSGLSSTDDTVDFGRGMSAFDLSDLADQAAISDEDLFSIAGSTEGLPVFTPIEADGVESTSESGWLGFLDNAALPTKNLLVALAAGIASTLIVGVVNFAASTLQPNRPMPKDIHAAMALAAGAAGFGAALGTGHLAQRRLRASVSDLQQQFDSVIQEGNLSARATVLSEDEFGHLASSFNKMARVILTTTSEAQRKAQEQEQAKEDLQRQVIRLLDDVEGAARGDLTVQAEVTADVLGAVADSFNLTIQNLREIVEQVSVAARQVSKGSTENEIFARSLSADALRQAEELAVTLNSVQVMTDSIQRVAESAREAEEVARSASSTALKGGEAVERTVAGILEIRETVAET